MGYTRRQLINAALEEHKLEAFEADVLTGYSYTKLEIINAALEKLGLERYVSGGATGETYTKLEIINAALEKLGLERYVSGGATGETYTKQEIINAALEKLGLEPYADTTPTNSYTKRELLNAAFEEIGLDPVNFDMTAGEQQKCLRRLDAMLAAWLRDGIELGYSIDANPANPDIDEASDLSDWAHEVVYLNLAVKIAPVFGKTIIEQTEKNAVFAYRKLRAVSASYQNKCLNHLDMMVAAWLRDGIEFGYNLPTSSTPSTRADATGMYDWAHSAVYLNLAIKIASLFNMQVPDALVLEAQAAYTVLARRGVSSAYQNKCLEHLDMMVAAWLRDGVQFGYALPTSSTPSVIGDATGMYDWAHGAVYLNLAVKIASLFNMQVPEALAIEAQAAYTVLARRAVSSEYQNKCLEHLDAMMARWARRGIEIGYSLPTPSVASNLTDASNLYNWALDAVYQNLAIKISILFPVEITQIMITEAEAAYETVKDKGVNAFYLQKCLRRLDSMLADWDGDGIPLGYTLASSPELIDIEGESNIPDYACQGVYLNLAIAIADIFEKPVSHELRVRASKSKKMIRRKRSTRTPMQMPNNLPVGAGNKPHHYSGYNRFFRPKEALSDVDPS